MSLESKRINISEVEGVTTSHNTGTKKVLLPANEQPVLIKQVALGILEQGEKVSAHTHPDMDEHYFFLRGNGIMRVDDQVYRLAPGDFILVKAGSEHELLCDIEKLEFYYQGFQLLSP
ncbi:MAG: cupin domain-containing protein [Flavitalea sp.]